MANYKYVQLANWIRAEIESGSFSEHAKIPTEQELAKQFSLSRHTVRQALSTLRDEGLLHIVQGSGAFVVAKEVPVFKATASRTVGVVISFVNDYIFSAILTGINDYLTSQGFSISVRITSHRIQQEISALEAVLKSDLAGAIIEPALSALPSANFPYYQRIAKALPCVLIHGRVPGLDLPFISLAERDGAELLTNHLIERGHRTIAAVLNFDEQVGVNRYFGYVSALKRHGIPIMEERVRWYSNQSRAHLFSKDDEEYLMQAVQGCTAVFCSDDRIAHQLAQLLRARGIRVPEDISLVGYDDTVYAQMDLSLTTVAHPKEEYGRRAAQALCELMCNPAKDVSYSFEPQLIERQSVARLPHVI